MSRALARTAEPHRQKRAIKKQAVQPRQSRVELSRLHSDFAQCLDSSPVGYVSLAHDTTIKHINLAACAMIGVDRSPELALKFTDFVAPEDHKKFVHYQRAAADGTKAPCELTLRRADGTLFSGQLVSVGNAHQTGQDRGIDFWVSDVSKHNQTSHALQASEQRCRELFERAPLCMFMVDLHGSRAQIRQGNGHAQLVYGYSAHELQGLPLTALASQDAQSAIVATVAQVRQGVTVTHETVHRRRDGTPFTVRVNATADPTSRHCMMMIVEDTTVEHLRRSEGQAIDAERRRMSHEIHDSVAQRLAALSMRSALWHRLVDSKPPALHAALSELQAELAAAIEDIRRAIFAVRPVELNDKGFFAAVTQWINGFSEQNKVEIQLDFSGSCKNLSSDHELPLFRIIQEAFSNILRHAHASTARIKLDVGATGAVLLNVSDDGRGFDPSGIGPAARAPHFGLPQMRERVLELAGTLIVRSEIGQGTELAINLPPVTRQTQIEAYTGPQRRLVARRQKDRV